MFIWFYSQSKKYVAYVNALPGGLPANTLASQEHASTN